ncbi:MAG: TonB-dependent receptor [Sphingopyxis sp.]|nr:TonB-dependent receptor [Sphingopyxis sp.]
MSHHGRLLTAGSILVMALCQPALAQSEAPEVGATEAEAAGAKSGETLADPDEIRGDGEILVTGSRLRSGFASPTPVTVLSGEAIAGQRAPTQIGDLLNETPAFRPSGGASQGQNGTSAVGQATVDLRALGAVRTLVLVDGRRPVGTQLNGLIDTNLIPAGLIDRIDVVTAGASAAYGSDAVSGVVNFVLKDRLDGINLSVSTGIAEAGDNREDAVTFAAGKSFADDRLRILVGGDYVRGEGVESMYSRDWGRLEPGVFTPSTPRAPGVPAQILGNNIQIRNPTGGVIVAGPLTGTAFGPNGVPYQYQFGNPLGSTEQQGTSNYGFNRLGNQYLRGPFERYSALGRISFDVADDTTLFAEANYGRLAPKSRTSFGVNQTYIFETSNPFLPTEVRDALVAAGQTTFRMGRLYNDVGTSSTRNVNSTLRVAVGGRGKLGDNWSWDAYGEYGRGVLDFRLNDLPITPNFLAALYAVRDTNGQIVCGPVASNPNLSAAQRAQVEPGCVPYNPFGPYRGSDAARDYMAGDLAGRTLIRQDVAAINFQGTPFELPAGPVSVAFGYEHRSLRGTDTVTDETFRRSIIGAFAASNRLPSTGKVTVNEGYFEAEAPILVDRPLAKTLSLNGAVRYTDYSTSGGVTTWKAGFVYEPFDGLRLRGTRSRDIRAPNISELFGVAPEGATTQTNPVTGGSAAVRTQAVSNPNLKPEVADTLTIGAVIQPVQISGLRLSVDYYDIKIDDVIISVSAAEVLRRYFLLGQTDIYGPFIEFVPTTVNPTGFQKVSSPFVNASSLQTRGVDAELAYRLPVGSGDINLSVLGSYVIDLKTTDISGTINSAGGTTPELRVTSNIGYKSDRFATNLQVRYNSARKYSDTLVGPEDPGYDPASPVSISRNRLAGAAYLTLSASYDIMSNGDKKVQLFGVVNNLLDKDPPLGAYALTGQTATVNYYDFIGRSFRIGVRASL